MTFKRNYDSSTDRIFMKIFLRVSIIVKNLKNMYTSFIYSVISRVYCYFSELSFDWD